MAEKPARLERLIATELGECCEEDVDRRVETLESLTRETGESAIEPDLKALSALGNGTRYQTVRLLAAADRELCVCEVTPVVDVSESAVSHALSDLYDAGLVTRRKEGTWRYYGTTDRTERLLAALDATRGEVE
jgi:DNA-binding transcriptional ArsR family regulator